MMPPPFLPLYDLFRTQRRRSACYSCPGDSASRDQAPCCHSDHKVWVVARPCRCLWKDGALRHSGVLPVGIDAAATPLPPLTTFSLPNRHAFYPDPKHSLPQPRLQTQRRELLEVVLRDRRFKQERVFIFIYHPKRGRREGVGGAVFHPSRGRLQASGKKRKKEKHLCIIDVLICANAQVFVK